MMAVSMAVKEVTHINLEYKVIQYESYYDFLADMKAVSTVWNAFFISEIIKSSLSSIIPPQYHRFVQDHRYNYYTNFQLAHLRQILHL